jgi:hypothetical protein
MPKHRNLLHSGAVSGKMDEGSVLVLGMYYFLTPNP